MQVIWILSQFFVDPITGIRTPYASAYCSQWTCPDLPNTNDQWALVEVYIEQHQKRAIKKDPHCLICPNPKNQNNKISSLIANSFHKEAIPNLDTTWSFADLLDKLADIRHPDFSSQKR